MALRGRAYLLSHMHVSIADSSKLEQEMAAESNTSVTTMLPKFFACSYSVVTAPHIMCVHLPAPTIRHFGDVLKCSGNE